MNAFPAVRTARRPFLIAAGLTPLLLSVAICNAYAADVKITGQAGVAGVAGATATDPGTDGLAGANVSHLIGANADAVNRLTLTGGAGGQGGKGGVSSIVMYGDTYYYNSAAGGRGGDGGDAIGSVSTTSGTRDGVAESWVVGGNAGARGQADGTFTMNPLPRVGLTAHHGGAASSEASVIAAGGANVQAIASAVGGRGGEGRIGLRIDDGGAGGSADASAFGRSDSGNVLVSASATGGAGGLGAPNDWGFVSRSGAGAGVTLNNAVSGVTSGALTLLQEARGGSGGGGGNARSTLTLVDDRAAALRVSVSALGGAADNAGTAVDAGAAHAALTLESTRAGANLDGTIVATGGKNFASSEPELGAYNGVGGTAKAIGVLRGRGDVTGSAVATGGDSYMAQLAGTTSADLTLEAGGLATGRVSAEGGANRFPRNTYRDNATATLTMSGTGARGTAYANGDNATSTVNTVTTGALAVDVGSRTDGNIGSLTTATTNVQVTGGGTAGVNASARADGGTMAGAAVASVRVASAGAIVGTSYAKGGYLLGYATGNSTSLAHGETSGKHDVTLRATALSNAAGNDGQPAMYGSATATGFGRSGSGVVDVRSEARSGYKSAIAEARATSVTTEIGGVSKALATASGAEVTTSATALAVGARGNVGFGATASGHFIDSAVASSASEFSQSALALPATGGVYVTSVATAAPDAATASALTANAAGLDLVGAGMQAVGGGPLVDGEATLQTTSGSFQFESGAGEHVLLAFLSGGGSGFDLMISNHGVQLFSRSFTSGADAGLFFTNNLLDLGVFAAGAQDLLVQSSLALNGQGYGFSYLVGTGAGVSAVPEASTWLMMMIGMGGMLLVVRRRGAADTRA